MLSLDVYRLECLVRSYNALEWHYKFQYGYNQWLKVIVKTKEELEKENHCLKPSVMEDIADQHVKVMKDAKVKFLQMKSKFPEQKYQKLWIPCAVELFAALSTEELILLHHLMIFVVFSLYKWTENYLCVKIPAR